jgi:flagellar motor switch protein FliG
MSEPKSKGKNFDGIQSAAEMLNHLDKSERDKILKNIAEQDPFLTDKIRQKLFTFEDLVKLENSSLQLLLRTIPSPKLTLALRNMPQEFKDTLFKNISTRAANLLKEEMLSQGPQKLSSVTAAQQEITSIAKQLLAEGKIFQKKN